MEKYELTSDTIIIDGHVLHRIRALIDFAACDGTPVAAGTVGGYVESMDNLSQDGCSWVADNAVIGGDSWIGFNQTVGYNAVIS